MQNNVLLFMDPRAEDAGVRIVESAQRRRENQQRAIDREARRRRQRRVRWAINAVLISVMCLASFAAGAAWGCL